MTAQSLISHTSFHSRDADWYKRRAEKIAKQTSICKFCKEEFSSNKVSIHQHRCRLNPKRDEIAKRIATSRNFLSQNHKDSISRGMRNAHEKGIAWNLGKNRWNSAPSYPESFFMRVIDNEFENRNYTREFRLGRYSLDFAWVEKKMAIEIDSNLHDREHDAIRDKFCESKGWKILRIEWTNMFNDPKTWINRAKEFIEGNAAGKAICTSL